MTQTDRAVAFVEQATKGEPDVQNVLANVGRGNPQIYYNVFQKELASNFAEVFVELER